MGTWGVKLYENDTAADARDEWLGKLKQGASAKEATDEVLELLRGWDDPIAWIALADTQWTWGRLDARVLKAAQRALAKGADLELWTKPKERAARGRMFDQVAARLASPPPDPKAFKADSDAVSWKVGQLWAYRTLDRKWAILRVTAILPDYGLVPAPMFEVLDVAPEGDEPPTADFSGAGLRAARPGWNADPRFANFAPEHRESPMIQVAVRERGERPRRRLRQIRAAGQPRPADTKTEALGLPWYVLDEVLADVFRLGGPRPGAIVPWPLPEGGAGYAMIELGRFDDRMINPNWQVSLLDCRGDDLDPKTLEAASVTARLLVDGYPPPGLREVARRRLRDVDQISGAVYKWEDIPRELAKPPREAAGSNDVMKAFMAAVAKKLAAQKAAKSGGAKPKTTKKPTK